MSKVRKLGSAVRRGVGVGSVSSDGESGKVSLVHFILGRSNSDALNTLRLHTPNSGAPKPKRSYLAMTDTPCSQVRSDIVSARLESILVCFLRTRRLR